MSKMKSCHCPYKQNLKMHTLDEKIKKSLAKRTVSEDFRLHCGKYNKNNIVII